MILGIVSDLHLEFRDDRFIAKMIKSLNAVECDKLIIAGDIHQDKDIRNWFLSNLKTPYFHVLGNHDYYGYTGEWEDDFKDEDGIVGACLWSNWKFNPITDMVVENSITDFKTIPNFSLQQMKYIHEEHKKKIFESGSEIVVTHFAPTELSITAEFKNDSCNRYFCNDMAEEILSSKKKLWISGHIHRRIGYYMGDCLVVHNPLGYPNENRKPYAVMLIDTENLPKQGSNLVPGFKWHE